MYSQSLGTQLSPSAHTVGSSLYDYKVPHVVTTMHRLKLGPRRFISSLRPDIMNAFMRYRTAESNKRKKITQGHAVARQIIKPHHRYSNKSSRNLHDHVTNNHRQHYYKLYISVSFLVNKKRARDIISLKKPA